MNPAPVCRHHALLVLGGRRELAFHTLHGEPLYAHALRALANAAGPVVVGVDRPDLRRVRNDVERWRLPVTVLLYDDWWDTVRDAPGAGVVAHDALCPLVPADFLTSLAQQADERPTTAFVAVRPVTDTLKAVVDGRIQETIDRDSTVAITSPIVVPSEILVRAGSKQPPPFHDFAAMVGWLRERGEVELVRAPSLGRRVEHPRAVHLLECLDEVSHRVRAEPGHPSSVAEDRP